MRQSDILAAMEEVVALPDGTLRGDEVLAGLPGWDSLSGVAFRVAAQKRWQVSLSGVALGRCETVADIVRLFAPRLER